ncbi:MAG: response regulator [Lachnospiraceae bacterium]|nr:response regulator [Lachnospiraceae bacterium]
MSENRMIVVGEKETFVPRVLVKKVQDAGVDCRFVPWIVNDINSNLNESTLITLYMDEDVRPPEDVLHFLIDAAEEKGLQMIIVGEQNDVRQIKEKVSPNMVYTTFSRPVDNTEFVKTISDYFAKVESGEFKKSILIVDDDTRYMALVREWLKSTYKVSMANSGLQAIKFLGKNKVDLILLDHEMPVTGGPQVLEMLRSDPETASIPVMFLTGKGDKESVMEVVALKPEGYFLKSIQKEELLEKLQEFFILRK